MAEVEQGSNEYWQQVEELFHLALELPESEREAFLKSRCQGPVQKEVGDLLNGYEEQARCNSTFSSNPAGTRYGPYEIVRKIGAGGMGEVYLAQRREDFERLAAIKVIANRLLAGPVLIERFLRERQILARLDHPNIAHLLDGGVTPAGQPYLVMEYVEGVRLDRYCEQHALTLEARLALFRKVCAAVAYAHAKRIVHRDLKPSNILVNEQGEPKLLDFGVAKMLQPSHESAADNLTMTGALLVTPRYASPERLAGGQATAASDVYSLGVILYELLTGSAPYPGDDSSPGKLIGAMMTRRVAPPSASASHEVRRRLRRGLDAVVVKALAKQPEDRYQSAAELADAIASCQTGTTRRCKAPWITGAAAAVLAVIMFAVFRGWGAAGDLPPLYLAVLPVRMAPSAADLADLASPITEKINSRMLRTWGVQLCQWQKLENLHAANAFEQARRSVHTSLYLETVFQRVNGALLASMSLRRGTDGGAAWSGTFPFDLADRRQLYSSVDALLASSVLPVLQREANYLDFARTFEPLVPSPLTGIPAERNPCAHPARLGHPYFGGDIRLYASERASGASSFDTHIPFRIGMREFPSDQPMLVKPGTALPLDAPPVAQLASDTCVLTSFDGSAPIYAAACVVPSLPHSTLELNYVCAPKAYPIDLQKLVNESGLTRDEFEPAGGRLFGDVPFLLPEGKYRFWRGQTASAGSARPVSLTIPVGRAGISTAYFLLNTEWGQPGPASYLSLAFQGDQGAFYEKKLIGGVDVRDYHKGVFTNTLNGTTSRQVFDNGSGERIDLVEVALPPIFRTQMLRTITLNDTGRLVFQRAILRAVTVR